jgi:hypothetical protein
VRVVLLSSNPPWAAGIGEGADLTGVLSGGTAWKEGQGGKTEPEPGSNPSN